MLEDFSHSNSSKLLFFAHVFLLLSYLNHIILSILHQYFLHHFLAEQSLLSILIDFMTWFCYLHRFYIQILNKSCFNSSHFIAGYFLDYSFSCPLQQTLFQAYSLFQNSPLFFSSKQNVPSYSDLFVNSGKVERYSFLTHDLA